MIGLADEMLLYLSYSSKDFKKVCCTNYSVIQLRYRLGQGAYGEEQMAEWLTKLGCIQIRPQVVIPAVIIDRHKRVFDEHTFVRLYCTDSMKDDLKRKLNMETIFIRGGYLHERALKIFLRKRKAYVDAPRCVLPSVWEFSPAYAESVSPRISQTIGRIIGNRIPLRE